MPNYTWRCHSCENVVSVERSFDEYELEPEDVCDCGEHQWYRLIGPTSFILQGQGWYNKGGY